MYDPADVYRQLLDISLVDIAKDCLGDKLIKLSISPNYKALCPFAHQEKTPSFWIWPSGNGFYCHRCGEQGNVVDFILKLKGNEKGIQYLARETGFSEENVREALDKYY
jgi:DNA primase